MSLLLVISTVVMSVSAILNIIFAGETSAYRYIWLASFTCWIAVIIAPGITPKPQIPNFVKVESDQLINVIKYQTSEGKMFYTFKQGDKTVVVQEATEGK